MFLAFGCTTDNSGNTTVVPLAPTGLTATVVSTTQVKLNWTDNATNETGYKIQRKTGNGIFADIASTGTYITTHDDLGLTANTSYTYRVYAFNNAGNSIQYSNEVTVNTSTVSNSNISFIWSTYNPVTDSINSFLCRNGISSQLSGSANDIFAIGSDVYLCGRLNKLPTIWKNDIAYTLNINPYTRGNATSVFVQGSDVYAVGVVSSNTGGNKPALWKNNALTLLNINNGSSGWAKNVFVSGNDVYVVGYVDIGTTSSIYYPAFWKNGVLTRLATYGTASSVFVSGSDVYVVGDLNQIANSDNIPFLWKNGTTSQLAIGGEATSVFVSGSDVYVAGCQNILNNFIPTYWKNGNAVQMFSLFGIANSILVVGNDVYAGISGQYQSGDQLTPIYWKNGISTQFSNLEGWVSDIIVTP